MYIQIIILSPLYILFLKKKKKINKNIFSVFFPPIQNGMIYFLMTLES